MTKILADDKIPKMDDCPWRTEATAGRLNTPYGKPVAFRQCPSDPGEWRLREWKLETGRIVREIHVNFLDVFPRKHNYCVWFGDGDLEPILYFPYMFSDEQVEQAVQWHTKASEAPPRITQIEGWVTDDDGHEDDGNKG